MSFSRENIVWKSEDGKWSIGFYKVIPGDISDPDYDPEWDVEYDFGEFEWVSTGHPTEQAAHDAWDGANPGGGWTTEDAEEAKKCDTLAATFLAQNPDWNNGKPRTSIYRGYSRF